MSQLAVISIIVGCLVLAWHLLLVARPQTAGSWIRAFPRSVWPGRVLAAVDMAWVAVLFLSSNFKWVEGREPLLVLFAAAALVLIVLFMDDLLSARALGGLFLLAPAPVLNAAFVHPSSARLVMTVFAYILTVLGIVWVWSPFMLRKMTQGWISRPGLVRLAGAAGCAMGIGFIVLGLFVY